MVPRQHGGLPQAADGGVAGQPANPRRDHPREHAGVGSGPGQGAESATGVSALYGWEYYMKIE